MNILITLFLTISTGAFAQTAFDVENVTFHTRVPVTEMKCIIPVADGNRIYTEFSHGIRKGFDSIELDHTAATVIGCDMEALKEVLSQSHNHFGFSDVEVTVRKLTAKLPQIINGKCQRFYKEKLVLDFGNGIILETRFIGIVKPSNNCEYVGVEKRHND